MVSDYTFNLKNTYMVCVRHCMHARGHNVRQMLGEIYYHLFGKNPWLRLLGTFTSLVRIINS